MVLNLSLLKEKWLWIIIVSLIFMVLFSFTLVWILLLLPEPFNLAAFMTFIIAWGIASGYKDWILSRKKEETKKKRNVLTT